MLSRYASRSHVTTERHGDLTEVRVEKHPVVVKLVIPDDIFEWWVTVLEGATGEELVADWCDHYGDTDERLTAEMEDEIARVLHAVVDPPVRVVSLGTSGSQLSGKPKTQYALQSGRGGEWQQVVPFAID